MTLLDEIHAKRELILASAKKHGVKDVRVFGSAARGEETVDSDIDLLINVSESSKAFGFLDFQEEVQELLEHNVDIVFEAGMFPPMLEYISNDLRAI